MSSSIAVNEEFILADRPIGGTVGADSFKKQTLSYPKASELKDGQVIAKLLYASVDPSMRRMMRTIELKAVNSGYGVAEVLDSKSPHWKVGEIFFDILPWRRFTIVDVEKSETVIRVDKAFLQAHHLTPSVYLSALGMVSRTAYFGVRDVLQINRQSTKSTDSLTLVVSGAAGGVGSLAIQFARLLGAKRIIGVAGGKDKCEYLVKVLGADAAIDYKEFSSADDLRTKLQELAPNGVDRYFDNTGGPITDAIFDVINKFARVAVCGQISNYTHKDVNEIRPPTFLHKIIYKSATVQGYYFGDYAAQYNEFFKDVNEWLAQGKLIDKQHVINGFDQIPKAFHDLFAGANTGKIVIDCTK